MSDMSGGATGATLPEGWPANLQPQDYKGDDSALRGKKIIMYNGAAHTYSVSETGQVMLTPAVPPPDGTAAQSFTFATVNGKWLDPQLGLPLLAIAKPGQEISQWGITEAMMKYDDTMREIFEKNKDMYKEISKLLITTLVAKMEEAVAQGKLTRQQAELAVWGAGLALGMNVLSVGTAIGTSFASRKAAGKAEQSKQEMKELNRAGDDLDARNAVLQRNTKPGEEQITAGELARKTGQQTADAKAYAQMATVLPQFMQALAQQLPTIFFEKDKADVEAAKKHSETAQQGLEQLAQRLVEMLREISQGQSSDLRSREELNRALTESRRMGTA